MNLLARTLDGVTEKPSGLKAIIGRFASGRRPDDALHQDKSYNPPAIPQIPVVNIDQTIRRYLMDMYRQRTYSFVVFSSQAKQDIPDFDSVVRALRNGEGVLNLRLVRDDFSANAECRFDDTGYMLRVTNVVAEDDYTHMHPS